MMEFLEDYSMSADEAFKLFLIIFLADFVYKIFTDRGIVKKGTALYVYWIQIVFYLIIIAFCKDTILRVLYCMNCILTVKSFYFDWRINHPGRRETVVMVPIFPDGTVAGRLRRTRGGIRKKDLCKLEILARYDKAKGKYIIDDQLDLSSDNIPEVIKNNIKQNIPPMEDGMIFYLWKSNLPEDEEELKKYLMDSLIVQKEYVSNLKRDFLKPAKIRLQFIGERTDSVVIPYKEFDDRRF